jgi:ABC-type Fe3+ transport system permease subunit
MNKEQNICCCFRTPDCPFYPLPNNNTPVMHIKTLCTIAAFVIAALVRAIASRMRLLRCRSQHIHSDPSELAPTLEDIRIRFIR